MICKASRVYRLFTIIWSSLHFEFVNFKLLLDFKLLFSSHKLLNFYVSNPEYRVLELFLFCISFQFSSWFLKYLYIIIFAVHVSFLQSSSNKTILNKRISLAINSHARESTIPIIFMKFSWQFLHHHDVVNKRFLIN